MQEEKKNASQGGMDAIDPDEYKRSVEEEDSFYVPRKTTKKASQRSASDEMDTIDPEALLNEGDDVLGSAPVIRPKKPTVNRIAEVDPNAVNEDDIDAIAVPTAKKPSETASDSGMDSIDLDEYKKGMDDFDEKKVMEAISPIEVKSTRHIELQKREEQKKENIVSAHTAANEVFDWLESILMAIVIIVLVFTFIVRVNTVDGTSMLPTLTEGQKLIVTDLFYTPDYNDIVIIQAAKLDGGKPIVKRVIGLPGDTIKIDFDNGIVYRNGEALLTEIRDGFIYEDGHTIYTLTTRQMEMVSMQDYTVPDGCYFVMGDNRDNSKDSRLFSEIGFVEENYIAGHAIFSIFPVSSFGPV